MTGFAEAAGHRLRYRIRGDGPPLLMLNGLGAPLELWRPLESRLGDFQTITVDLPGSGRSSVPTEPFGIDRFAEVLEEFLNRLEVDRTSVLGLSFGGQVAQELARRCPGRIERLILASTASSRTFNPRMMSILAGRARALYRADVESLGRRRTGHGGESLMLRSPWDLSRALPSRRGFLVQLRAGLGWSSRPWLDELRMPVLVIAGADDLIIPVSQGARIAACVSDGRLEVIPGGGHLYILRHPRAASDLIRSFLRES